MAQQHTSWYNKYMELYEYVTKPIEYYKKWQYRNTGLLIISLIVFFYFSNSDWLRALINYIGNYGYLGAFVSGIFFVSTFTIAPAAAVLFNLANKLNPLEVAILAGLGGMVGDYFIFRFFKDRVFRELAPLLKQFGGGYVRNIFKTPYFVWMSPFIGAILVASPLPDELGIGLLGASRLKDWQFLLLVFLLDVAGVFIIVTISQSI